MAERLTIKNSDNTYSHPTDTTFEMVFNKLGELEDIFEKYGIESVKELDFRLAFKQNDVFNYKEITKLETDRDTWKMACELACENMKLPVDILIGNKEFNECHSIVEYFYQQAKEESESK